MPATGSGGSVARLSRVLHDACVVRLVVDRDRSTAEIVVRPLRADRDGRPLHDPRVVVRLKGLRAMAVCYRPWDVMARPSRFRVPERLQIHPDSGELCVEGSDEWGAPSRREVIRDHLTDPKVEWMVGRGPPRGTPLALYPSRGITGVRVSVLLWFARFEASEFSPLPMGRWEKEFDRWWKGWKKGWDTGKPASEYSSAIPAGVDEPSRWTPAPHEPVWTVPATRIRAQLLAPIRQWASKEHAIDRASKGAQGSLPYLREVVGWWVEGDRAAVLMRGIGYYRGHAAADPEVAFDEVFSCGLVRRDRKWELIEPPGGQRTSFHRPRIRGRRPNWLKEWTACPIE